MGFAVVVCPDPESSPRILIDEFGMPVRIKCPCGKLLNVKDELRGKQIKCPGCGKVLRVPAAAAKVAAKTGKPSEENDSLDDLFMEEGFNRQVAAVCPSCRAEMAAGAVLCTKCGFNKQTGQKLAGHKTPGVDIGMGTLALQKAENDMRADKEVQERMLKRSGMPWWMLGLVLFVIVSAVGVSAAAVNAAMEVEGEGEGGRRIDTVGWIMTLSGTAFSMVGVGAALVIIVAAFKESLVEGLLYLFVPFYAVYFWFKHFKQVWRPLLLMIVAGGIGGGLIVAGMTSLQGG